MYVRAIVLWLAEVCCKDTQGFVVRHFVRQVCICPCGDLFSGVPESQASVAYAAALLHG